MKGAGLSAGADERQAGRVGEAEDADAASLMERADEPSRAHLRTSGSLTAHRRWRRPRQAKLGSRSGCADRETTENKIASGAVRPVITLHKKVEPRWPYGMYPGEGLEVTCILERKDALLVDRLARIARPLCSKLV
jgi:hypothetical protein